MEEAGRELRRLRGAVEGAMVGENPDPDGEDLAVTSGSDLAAHVVITGEGRAHQVL